MHNPTHVECAHQRRSEAQRNLKRYTYALAIGFITMGFEVICGIQMLSLGLIADAEHIGLHVGAFIVAIVVTIVGLKRPENETYAQVAGTTVVIVLLAMGATWIVIEAIQRSQNPSIVFGKGVMIAAAIGALGNIWQLFVLEGVSRTSLNRALLLHIEQDLYISGGIILSGLAIALTEIHLIDPIVSVLVAIYIFRQIVRLMRDPSTFKPHAH